MSLIGNRFASMFLLGKHEITAGNFGDLLFFNNSTLMPALWAFLHKKSLCNFLLAIRALMHIIGCMMYDLDCKAVVLNIEETAKNKGISVDRLCDMAGVARSTLTRAKNGTETRISTFRKLWDALANHQ